MLRLTFILIARRRRATHPFADSDGLAGKTFGVGDALLHDALEQLLLVNPIKRWLEARDREAAVGGGKTWHGGLPAN